MKEAGVGRGKETGHKPDDGGVCGTREEGQCSGKGAPVSACAGGAQLAVLLGV